MPSTKVEYHIYMFTDASSNAYSAILTQKLKPLRGGEPCLHIIGCWSAIVPKSARSQPIWVLELSALYLASMRWSAFLLTRPFTVISDNATVVNWANLDRVPKDIARRVIHLQKFAYRVLYINTVLNPSDAFSRQDGAAAPLGFYPRFLHDRIVNAEGRIIPVERLFSARKREEIQATFADRKQAMSAAREPQELEAEARREEEESGAGAGKIGELVEAPVDEITINALALDDEDLAKGRVVEDKDQPFDDAFKDFQLPELERSRIAEVKRWQDDHIIKSCIEHIQLKRSPPSKIEILSHPVEFRKFMVNESLFRVKDGVLWRLWVDADGNASALIVLGEAGLMEVMMRMHGNGGEVALSGGAKLFKALASRYYAFSMRKKSQHFVANCPACRLANHPRTRPEKDGNQIALNSNDVVMVDFIGPLQAFAQSSSGKARYIFLSIDSHSRFVTANVTTSTSDAAVLDSLKELRLKLNGLPRKIASDNAINTKNSKSLEFLRQHAVQVLHGMPNVSRCQAKIERVNSTIMRLICKMMAEDPNYQFRKAVAEAVLVYNTTPHSALPRGLSPRELHFTTPPPSYFDVTKRSRTETPPFTLREEVVMHEVAQHLKRKRKISATDYTAKVKVGDLVMKKRTTFPTGVARKTAFKVALDAYQIAKRIATNTYLVKSILNGKEVVLPGDQIVRMKYHDHNSLKRLVKEMKMIASPPTSSSGSIPENEEEDADVAAGTQDSATAAAEPAAAKEQEEPHSAAAEEDDGAGGMQQATATPPDDDGAGGSQQTIGTAKKTKKRRRKKLTATRRSERLQQQNR